MSKCEIWIELNRSDRRYKPGETVEAIVHVKVDEDCDCKGLGLRRFWRTHGKGNRDRGPIEEVTLFEGEWSAGEYHRYSHTFPAPDGPFSYHGQYVNVDWYLSARADLPWALDPRAEEEFLVEPGPTTGSATLGDPKSDLLLLDTARLSGLSLALVLLFGGPFLTIGAVFLTLGVFRLVNGPGHEAVPFMFMGGMFSLFGGLLLTFAFTQYLAGRKVGSIEAQLRPRVVHPGESVEVSLRLMPPGRLELNAITAALVGEEVAVSGSGTSRQTFRHPIHEEEQALAVPVGVTGSHAGSYLDLQTRFTLPDPAPPTFCAGDNRVHWKIQFRVDIPRWPDWVEEQALVVVPPGVSFELPNAARD
jgi:hypothetical protein